MKRKNEHIKLALEDKKMILQDQRFYYEPLLSAHPLNEEQIATSERIFLNKKVAFPLWVSSMTGGSELAETINRRLARMCKKYHLPLALGSCRKLLEDDQVYSTFAMREELGSELPLLANLGIAQVEKLLHEEREEQIITLMRRLDADALVIHINPIQEWLQPEGDRIKNSPLHTLKEFFTRDLKIPTVVKEVGQGFGPQSLRELAQLPLAALELAGWGGTNFATIENQRSQQQNQRPYESLGHTCLEMLDYLSPCPFPIIAAGGIKNFLDGHYFTEKLGTNSFYGMAGPLLKAAYESEKKLDAFVKGERRGYHFAQSYLHVK